MGKMTVESVRERAEKAKGCFGISVNSLKDHVQWIGHPFRKYSLNIIGKAPIGFKTLDEVSAYLDSIESQPSGQEKPAGEK